MAEIKKKLKEPEIGIAMKSYLLNTLEFMNSDGNFFVWDLITLDSRFYIYFH